MIAPEMRHDAFMGITVSNRRPLAQASNAAVALEADTIKGGEDERENNQDS